MFLRDKSNGEIFATNGKFETHTIDWNDDGDVYTDTVMFAESVTSDGYLRIRKCDMCEFEEVNDEVVAEIKIAQYRSHADGIWYKGVFYYSTTDGCKSGSPKDMEAYIKQCVDNFMVNIKKIVGIEQ